MSVSFSNFVPPQCAEHRACGRRRIPEQRRVGAGFCEIARQLSGSIALYLACRMSHRNTAIGTPQTRWREMHQSGRVSTMLAMRSSPHSGSHLTFLISSSAAVRKVPPCGMGVSIDMNHCSVARKITGLWQRQQCGYECSTLSSCRRAPRDFSSSTIAGFALKHLQPVVFG